MYIEGAPCLPNIARRFYLGVAQEEKRFLAMREVASRCLLRWIQRYVARDAAALSGMRQLRARETR